MNARQIIKALECCASPKYLCEECPIDQKKKDDCSCGQFLEENALALITSQEQRIEAYRMELAEARVALNDANNRLKECENGYEGTLHLERAKLHDAEEKVKNLTEEVADLKAIAEQYQKQFEEAKADTVSEMQTRFALRYGTYTDKDMTPITEVFRLLDQIAKEMSEEGGG